MPGYKYSDIGFVPEEWDVKRLCNFASVATGSTPPTSDATNYGDDFLFVSPVDMGEAKFITRTEKRLSPKGFSISRKFPRGSILFVCIGSTIGKCGIASTELTSNQQINAIFPSPIFSEDYLYYAMAAVSPRVRALAGEQAVPLVNKTQFSETYVPLPPLPEQHAIAQALSDVDALLATLDQMIVKKRDLKQAAMQQLLTSQTRLPGFSGEWEVKRLDELASLYQPQTISAQLFTEAGFPVYGANGVVGFYHSSNHETWQVTVTCRGSTCGTVNRTVNQCWITGNAMVLNCDSNQKLSKDFFYYLMLAQDMSDCITGTGQPQIVRAPLSAFKVRLPIDPGEQSAIAETLTDMDAELSALEARRDKTRNLKQAMMQELLTGKTRLVSNKEKIKREL